MFLDTAVVACALDITLGAEFDLCIMAAVDDCLIEVDTAIGILHRDSTISCDACDLAVGEMLRVHRDFINIKRRSIIGSIDKVSTTRATISRNLCSVGDNSLCTRANALIRDKDKLICRDNRIVRAFDGPSL